MKRPRLLLRDRLAAWILRRLGVPCGAFGGFGRWCLKPFGHDDSCAYEVGLQPLWEWRRRMRGWSEQ